MASLVRVAVLLAVGIVGSQCQILHSVDRMTVAIQHQAELAGHLQEYIKEERKRLDALEKSAERLQKSGLRKTLSKSELEAELSHPVRVLRLVRDLYSDVDFIAQSVDFGRISPEMNNSLSLLPGYKDFIDATEGLVRLQEMYRDKADFTRVHGNNTKDVLTANEVLDIGRVCIDQKNYYSAIANLQRAKEMFEEEKDIPMSMQAYDYLAIAVHEQGNTVHALNYTYELIEYCKEHEPEAVGRLEENIDIYIDVLGGEEQAAQQLKLIGPLKNEKVETFRNYDELCRGEKVKALGQNSRELLCHLDTNRNHPLLVLAPAKVEELNLQTGLSYYHHVLTDKEILLLQDKARDKFGDSQLVPEEEARNDPDIQLDDDNSYADAKVRSSNTGWVDDDEDEMVFAISRRVSAMLGLSLDSAEAFQVLSYGVGGFYLPHFDWGAGEDPFEGFGGNRIATWIFYLNNIKQGGATVFPDIGATVWPEKGGAAFWRNLYKNGTGDPLTLHAACPVLEGYKWASNKWFHTEGNELSWPCDVNPDA